MQDLWGNPIESQQPQKQPTRVADITTSDECFFYGHTWISSQISSEKICTLCGIHGYCPGCTPVKPSTSAIPAFCTQHTMGRMRA